MLASDDVSDHSDRVVLQSATALFTTKCDSYFITKCDKCYYKVRQVLQSATLLQSVTVQTGSSLAPTNVFFFSRPTIKIN